MAARVVAGLQANYLVPKDGKLSMLYLVFSVFPVVLSNSVATAILCGETWMCSPDQQRFLYRKEGRPALCGAVVDDDIN